MTIFDFTVEEVNLVAIYKADTKTETLQRIFKALPYMDDEMRDISKSAARKLVEMNGAEFATTVFTPADDTEEG